MRLPALHAVVLALLVATAGCSGVGSQSTVDTTVAETTGTETTTNAERTATEEGDGEAPAELAPGLSERGVEDATALANAHRERLADESLTIDSVNVERYENGSVRERTNVTTRTAANRTRYRIAVNTTEPNWLSGTEGEGELWANGTHVFRAHAVNGTTNYDLDPDSASVDPREYLFGDLTNSDRLLVLFTAFEGERVQQVDDGDATDRERYRVTATDLAHPDFLGPDDAAARNATLDAEIETGGPEAGTFVREYTLRYEITVEGEVVTVTERVRFSNVGETTVERPEWYDGPTNRTV